MNSAITPPSAAGPVRVRIEGVLDAVRASDQSFTLRLEDGRELPGRLIRGAVAGLGRVLGRHLIVFGSARFSSSGQVEEVEADGFIPNDGQPWTRSPDDFPVSPDVTAELARRLKAVVGTWPGNETDEQVEKALREQS